MGLQSSAEGTLLPCHRKYLFVVDYTPQMSLETNAHLGHTLRFQNPKTPESGAIPEGQEIYLESYMGEANMADADIPFANGMKVTHQLYPNFAIGLFEWLIAIP